MKVYADSFGVGGEAHWTTIPEGTLLDVGKWNSNSPSHAIASKGTLATDAEGVIHLGDLPGAFAAGDSFILTYHGHQEPTQREYHDAVDNLVYEETVDNLYIRPEDGRVIPAKLGSCPTSVVKTFLSHTMIHFNLVVSIEWPSAYDTGAQYVDDLKQMFRKASDYLFDVSNGQAALGKIAIYDDMSHWLGADLRIFASNEAWPDAHVNGAYRTAGADVRIKFPPVFRGPGDLNNRVAGYESNPGLEEEHPRAFVHELGHYAFGFFDEYADASGNSLHSGPNYGFMRQERAGSDPAYGMDSEMSWAWPPWVVPSEYALTAQAANNANLTCAEHMDYAFSRATDPVPAKLRYTPAEYFRVLQNPHWFRGPNDNGVVDTTGISMGARVQFANGVTTVALHQALPFLVTLYGSPAGAARVWLKKPTRVIDLGRTPMFQYKGRIKLLGADPGDIVFASYSDSLPMSQAIYALPPVMGASSLAGVSSAEDTLALRPIQGNYAMLAAASFNGNGQLRYTVTVPRDFGGPAEVGIVDGGTGGTTTLTREATGYSANIATGGNRRTVLYLSAADSLGGGLFAFHELEVDSLTPISGELRLDQLPVQFRPDSSSTIARIAFLGTDFPPPVTGLPPTAYRMSPVVHLATDPGNAMVAGRLGIAYGSDPSADHQTAPRPHIYHWQNAWVPLETQDDGRQMATASIENPGFYAVFAESVAVTGVPEPRAPGERQETLMLEPGQPNPSHSATAISFVLHRAETVTLRVYDTAGRLVRNLIATETRTAGRQTVTWDGRDNVGKIVGSGIYIIKLEAGGASASRKITLIR